MNKTLCDDKKKLYIDRLEYKLNTRFLHIPRKLCWHRWIAKICKASTLQQSSTVHALKFFHCLDITHYRVGVSW